MPKSVEAFAVLASTHEATSKCPEDLDHRGLVISHKIRKTNFEKVSKNRDVQTKQPFQNAIKPLVSSQHQFSDVLDTF